MSDLQEKTLIAAVRDGDSEQYRFFVDRYHRGLILHLYRMTNNKQTAEDLAQEAFLRAYTKLSKYDDNYSFSTWLYKIADNLAYRQLKKHRPTSDLESLVEIIPDDKPSLGEMADKELSKHAVRRAIKKLPPDYQQVVSLFYWDDFSYEEISEITGRPIGTIRTWLFRAKEILRKDLYGQI